jgi:hypothetical protein
MWRSISWLSFRDQLFKFRKRLVTREGAYIRSVSMGKNE